MVDLHLGYNQISDLTPQAGLTNWQSRSSIYQTSDSISTFLKKAVSEYCQCTERSLMKRAVGITAIIVAALLITIQYINIQFAMGHRIRNFDQYKADFQLFADKMLAFGETQDLSEGFTVLVDYAKFQISYVKDGQKTPIPLTMSERLSLRNIAVSFDDSTPFTRIHIYKNRVTFCTEENWYAVAYTADDSRPKFMSGPGEYFDIYTLKIEKNWYHIASK